MTNVGLRSKEEEGDREHVDFLSYLRESQESLILSTSPSSQSSSPERLQKLPGPSGVGSSLNHKPSLSIDIRGVRINPAPTSSTESPHRELLTYLRATPLSPVSEESIIVSPRSIPSSPVSYTAQAIIRSPLMSPATRSFASPIQSSHGSHVTSCEASSVDLPSSPESAWGPIYSPSLEKRSFKDGSFCFPDWLMKDEDMQKERLYGELEGLTSGGFDSNGNP
ncbi:hypothetical protein G7K_0793-t1 [Saitoella complicata NRRL Y-17804]|uniref:Uncharacterized protein n=2 Tax=Saitoella complicata (strain BCRC 22490 / CBS 7301 / JCM 7358 / NBRC 10748 / NRRL Y-17804) TaxID=698492 RepID=A0A0E9N9U3_SAICN|nr:hypothetical protein G7K_0793-t1 [Saitoella complicata NRRL Y-17804]